MSQDEIAVMDGGKCIMQLRGVRPFFSNKFDITKHKQYRLLSDFDDKNALDIEKYVKNLCKAKVRDNDTVDEVEDAGVIEAWQLNIEKLNMEPVNQLQNFWTLCPNGLCGKSFIYAVYGYFERYFTPINTPIL